MQGADAIPHRVAYRRSGSRSTERQRARRLSVNAHEGSAPSGCGEQADENGSESHGRHLLIVDDRSGGTHVTTGEPCADTTRGGIAGIRTVGVGFADSAGSG